MDKNCKDCRNDHDCKSIYATVTKSKSTSVTARVSIAFLLPLVVFVTMMSTLDDIIKHKISSPSLGDFINLTISASVAFGCAMAAKSIYNFSVKTRNRKD